MLYSFKSSRVGGEAIFLLFTSLFVDIVSQSAATLLMRHDSTHESSSFRQLKHSCDPFKPQLVFVLLVLLMNEARC